MSSKKCENCNHIKITANGPYIVSPNIPLNEYAITPDEENITGHGDCIRKIRDYETEGEYALCRCGNSSNNPIL